MCNCGAKRRAAGPRTVAVPIPAPTATRSVVSVTVAPPPPVPAAPPRRGRFNRRRAGPPPPPPFHLPIVDTKVWGPRLWTVLHAASVAIPCADVWPRLVEELKMGLPCPDCTEHYTAWATAQPVTASTDMSAWFLALHNDVNRRIGGRRGWTCEEVTTAYTGRVEEGRKTLDALKGIIGEAARVTLEAILVSAAAEPVGAPETVGTELGPA